VINTSGALMQAGVAVSLALLGFSFMSIAWAYLASATTIAILALFSYRDLSIFKPCMHNWSKIIAFGGYNGANVFLYRVYESLPAIVLGRVLSVEAVALYSRSITLCQLPNNVIMGGAGSVLLPAFSAEVRNGADLRGSYLRSIEYIAALLWPAYLLLAVLAYPVVNIVLGSQWIDIVPLVQVMALASLFAISQELNYPVLVAVGGMRHVFIRSLIVWPISAVIVVTAAYQGLQAAALSWLIIIPFQALVSIHFVRNYISLTWAEIGQALTGSVVIAMLSIIGPLAVVASAGTFEISIPAAVLSVVLSAVGWAAALWLTKHPLTNDIRDVASSLFGVELKKKVTNHA
jgi:O-antigen/teichoic acid export membrane protein